MCGAQQSPDDVQCAQCGEPLPGSPTATILSRDIWRNGPLVVVRDGGELPRICVASGRTHDLMQRRVSLMWIRPLTAYLLGLTLVGLLLLPWFRQRTHVVYWVSLPALRLRRWKLRLGWGLTVLAVGGIGYCVAFKVAASWFILACVLAFAVAMMLLGSARFISLALYAHGFLWLSGAHEVLLSALSSEPRASTTDAH